MADLRQRIEEARKSVQRRSAAKPDFAIVLGTGLGGFAARLNKACRIPYPQIAGFARSTAPGHKGELVLGELEGRNVAVLEGRLHVYEGWTLDEITFPIRVLRALGAKILLLSNISGGMNLQYVPGDIVLVDDHINLMGANPLIGPNDDSLGPRFPDMSRPYDRELVEIAERAAQVQGIRVHRGVYVAVTGPNLETRAEYRFLRMIGADCVGMSTVPEVLVGVHAGFRILALSLVSDRCFPDTLEPVKLEEILEVARKGEPKITALLAGVVREAKA